MPAERVEKEFEGIVGAFIKPVDGEPRITELLRPHFALALHREFEAFKSAHENGNHERSSQMAAAIAESIATELRDDHYHKPPFENKEETCKFTGITRTRTVHNPVTPEEKTGMVWRLERLKSHFEEYAAKHG